MPVSNPILAGSLVGAILGTTLLTTLILLAAYKKRSPQPERYQAAERRLVTKIKTSYILDRVRFLRTSIELFVRSLQWKEYSKNEGSDIPVELSPSYIASVFQQHQYKDTGLHLNQDVLAKFRPGKDKGKHVLISITSWIILSNISLDGDSSFNLVSPTLAHLWKLCRSSHTDAWNQWAWGKARVYICQNLCPGIDPTEVAQYEPYREPLNNDAHEKAIALLENLLEPFFTFADSSREELHQCLVSAAYLGLFIHKDLRPWRFSFDYSGKTKGMPETDPSRWRDQTPDKNYVQKRLIEIGAGGKPVFRSHVLPPLSPEAQDPFFKLGKEFNVPSGKM